MQQLYAAPSEAGWSCVSNEIIYIHKEQPRLTFDCVQRMKPNYITWTIALITANSMAATVAEALHFTTKTAAAAADVGIDQCSIAVNVIIV